MESRRYALGTFICFMVVTFTSWKLSQTLRIKIEFKEKKNPSSEKSQNERQSKVPKTRSTKKQRDSKRKSDREVLPQQTFTFRSVATLRSIFVNKRGVPRQGSLAPAAVGR
mmetsp:Transcript_13494/g.17578  ORF Transcript_13494/g.17578 Transcript_13494/m.17578 type:complete len:111 (-) Transcript_13494:2069-2401(-)